MRIVRYLAVAGLAGAAFLSTPAGAIGVAPTCPSGSQGVVVTYNGSATYVCTTAVRDVQQVVASLHFTWTCEDICPDTAVRP